MGATKTDHFSDSQNELAVLAKALGHPARIAILEYLMRVDTCICGDIVNEMPLAQPTVSQHLKELKNAGLIKGNVEGTAICYCINEEGFQKINSFFKHIIDYAEKKKKKLLLTLKKYIMKLSEIKACLTSLDTLSFKLPNGSLVPENFHVTEVGLITKDFIDCGGSVRKETLVNFQLWEDANDEDHRLKPQKLANIIALSEKMLGIGDFEAEVEYQQSTIGKYNLDFDGRHFLLLNKQTACLAPDNCGISADKKKISLTEILSDNNSCTPGGGCC